MKEIKKKKGKRRWTRDDTDLTLISLPTFIWFVLFSYLPMFIYNRFTTHFAYMLAWCFLIVCYIAFYGM